MFRLVARHCRRLHDDREGQSMPIIAVSLLLLVVFSVAVINTGIHVTERQQMQTAVDASVYSAAAVKAKGMNMIVVTNLLLEALMAFRVIMEIVRDAILVAAIATLPLCALPGGCSVPTALFKAYNKFRQIVEKINKVIDKLFIVITKIAEVIKRTIPILAAVTAFRIAERNEANGALIWPIIDPLPVSKHDRKALCDHLQDTAVGFFQDIPVVGDIISLPILGDAIQGIIRGLVGLYCNGGPAQAAAGVLGDVLGDDSTREERNCNRCRSSDDVRGSSFSVVSGPTTTRTTFTYREDSNGNRYWQPSNPQSTPMPPSEYGQHGIERHHNAVTDTAGGFHWKKSGKPARSECGGAFDRDLGTNGAPPANPNPPLGTTYVEERKSVRLNFHSCAIKAPPQGTFGGGSGGGSGCDPTPHLLDHDPKREGCGVNSGGDYQTLIDARKMDVDGFAWLDIGQNQLQTARRYRPLGALCGDTGSFYFTAARAQFYSQGEPHDMWHLDWRARLVPQSLTDILNFDFGDSSTELGDIGVGNSAPTSLLSDLSGALRQLEGCIGRSQNP